MSRTWTKNVWDDTRPQRFWANTKPVGDCIIWQGQKTKAGYGQLRVGRYGHGTRKVYAHRWAWNWANPDRPVRDDEVIMHSCDNPSCVNPKHLNPGTTAENTRDAVSKGRMRFVLREQTHCKRGHPLSAPNAQITADGHRVCRACRNERARSYAAAKRAHLSPDVKLIAVNSLKGALTITEEE